jgi:hypothetical protein
MIQSEGPKVMIEPVIYFPRKVLAKSEHLLAIDLQLCTPAEEWPYHQEEFKIYTLVDTLPLFSNTPVGKNEIVLEKSGKTNGPVMFLLKATDREMSGSFRISFVNESGIPVIVEYVKGIEIVFPENEASQSEWEGNIQELLSAVGDKLLRKAAPAELSELLAYFPETVSVEICLPLCEWYTENTRMLLKKAPKQFEQMNAFLRELNWWGDNPLDLATDNEFLFLVWAHVFAGVLNPAPKILIKLAQLQENRNPELVKATLRNIWRLTQLVWRDYPWQLIGGQDPRLINVIKKTEQVALLCGEHREEFDISTYNAALATLEEIATEMVRESFIVGAVAG